MRTRIQVRAIPKKETVMIHNQSHVFSVMLPSRYIVKLHCRVHYRWLGHLSLQIRYMLVGVYIYVLVAWSEGLPPPELSTFPSIFCHTWSPSYCPTHFAILDNSCEGRERMTDDVDNDIRSCGYHGWPVLECANEQNHTQFETGVSI